MLESSLHCGLMFFVAREANDLMKRTVVMKMQQRQSSLLQEEYNFQCAIKPVTEEGEP